MTESKNTLPAPSPTLPTARRIRLWPLWLICVIALVTALVLAGFAWRQWQINQNLSTDIQRLNQQSRDVTQQLSQGSQQLDQRLQQLQQQQTDQANTLSRHTREIDHNANALLQAGHRSRTDWLLAEAEYLLRIANQRLQIESDYRGALKILQTADQVLKESDDAGVFPVRKALAQEIMALKGVQDVDRTGLYLQLEAAIETVDGLTDQALLKPSATSNQPRTQKTTDDSTPPNATGKLEKLWQETRQALARVIVIRRLDKPVKPLPSPEVSAYARLNLRLLLEQTEMALFRGNTPLYQKTLNDALHALNTWYDDSEAPVQALKSTLSDLAKRNINPPLPDISESLRLLKARLDGRNTTATPSSNSDAANSGDSTSATSTPDQGTAQ
ncbi:uroporphyrinogen-III C-methyltransferase [Mangrovitalea sediminis]|uniref:uroporphyrinogen-III C-methyltransferase n=1 Tax=Mangrovitalea sediminis TaxID=1982043 RepID=UPI000BE4EEB2|nr:uroporphyrinogen-III C-methyltransferase [Mangrovitalea sediminis]